MDNGATLAGLKQAIHAKLGIPLEDMLLSKNPALVRRGRAARRQQLLGCRWQLRH